jgi:alkylation response protein AidB-like acyl-CoA dehydrogenase
MDLDFGSEQEMLKDSALKFLANECPYSKVKEIEDSQLGYSPELWAKITELGWLGLLVPEKYKGYARREAGAFRFSILIWTRQESRSGLSIT